MDKIRLMGLLSFRSNTDPKVIIDAFKEFAYYKLSDKEELSNIEKITQIPLNPTEVDVLIAYMEKITGLVVHDSVVNKLYAYANLTSNDLVLNHWHLFEKVANALMDGIFDAEHVDPPSDIELVYTGYIFKRDASNKKHKISNEVKKYVQTLWQKEYGFAEPHPLIIDFWPLPTTTNTILTHQKHDEYVAKLKDLKELDIEQLLSNTNDIVESQAIRMALLSLEVKQALGNYL